MKLIALLFFVSGCVIPQPCVCPPPGATASPTPGGTRKPWPTMTPIAVPTPEPEVPFKVEMPSEVAVGESFKIIVAARESDKVVIWAEQVHHVGSMFWDKEKRRKYLNVKLNQEGQRKLYFKVNNEWVHSQEILVTKPPF